MATEGSVTVILSNGGGTQSTALLALIVQGKLPRPDYAAAVQVEQQIRQTDKHAFLHRSAVPLELIDWDAQRGLFELDELTCNTAGGCWV